MSFFSDVNAASARNNSLVCVGLDPDFKKLPECVKGAAKPFLEFNKAIVDATKDYVSCYKPQAAYYAGCGREDELLETISYIHDPGFYGLSRDQRYRALHGSGTVARPGTGSGCRPVRVGGNGLRNAGRTSAF